MCLVETRALTWPQSGRRSRNVSLSPPAGPGADHKELGLKDMPPAMSGVDDNDIEFQCPLACCPLTHRTATLAMLSRPHRKALQNRIRRPPMSTVTLRPGHVHPHWGRE